MTRDGVLSGTRVLAVHDDPSQLQDIAQLLAVAGAEVTRFSDGGSAVQALADGLAPDVIVTDLHMPGLDGWQLCRLVRSTDFPSFGAVPILVVSSTFAGADAEAVSAAAGAQAFLPLPSPPERLVRYVHQLSTGTKPRPDRSAVVFSEDVALVDGLVSALEVWGCRASLGRVRGPHAQCHVADWLILDAEHPEGIDRCLEPLAAAERRSTIVVLAEDVTPRFRLGLMTRGVDAVVPRRIHPRLLIDLMGELGRQRALFRVEEALKGRSAELTTAERRYEGLFQAIPDMVVLFDRAGRVTGGNAAARHALAGPDGWVGPDRLGERMTHDLLAPLSRRHRADTASGRMTLPDGSVRHVEGSYRLLEGPQSVVLAVFRDVTERVEVEARERSLEAKLVQGQKLESLGVMASGIAHDFNNLLLSILGNANLAADDLEANHPARRFIDQAALAAERAAELTAQILAYSGEAQRTVEPVLVAPLLRELGRLLAPAVSRKARLSVVHERDDLAVLGDPAQIRQVLMNVIVNASDALEGDAGDIRVGIRPESVAAVGGAVWTGDAPEPGAYVCIEVADTGCGMSQATVDRMFDPFFTTRVRGRGLGLAATLGIIRAHGGGIQVDTDPGRGTRFRIFLPACEGPAPVSETNAPTAAKSDEGVHQGRVLVVDDEDAVRDLVAHILELAGYEVVRAADGAEAVSIVEASGDGLVAVVLDTVMPVMDGAEALRRIKELAPDLPVVVTSGNLSAAIETGAPGAPDAILQKPYPPAALRAVLASVTGHRATG